VTEQSAQDRLSVEKQATIARIESLTGDVEDIDAAMAGPNSDGEHAPEGSTLAFGRARISTLLGLDRAYLDEIERRKCGSSTGGMESVSNAGLLSLASVWLRGPSAVCVWSADPRCLRSSRQ
jgi:hypothetical protein